MKLLSKVVFAAYLAILAWLVLFKFSIDISTMVGRQAGSLSLIPFVDVSRENLRETVLNVIVFIPFGLLLSVTFKSTGFWRKLACIFAFSLAAEVLQFIFAIGVADTTDLITNSFGGLIGLAFYNLGAAYGDSRKLDRGIVATVAIVLAAFTALLGALLSHGAGARRAPGGAPLERQEQARTR